MVTFQSELSNTTSTMTWYLFGFVGNVSPRRLSTSNPSATASVMWNCTSKLRNRYVPHEHARYLENSLPSPVLSTRASRHAQSWQCRILPRRMHCTEPRWDRIVFLLPTVWSQQLNSKLQILESCSSSTVAVWHTANSPARRHRAAIAFRSAWFLILYSPYQDETDAVQDRNCPVL